MFLVLIDRSWQQIFALQTPYSLTALAVIVYGQIEKGKGFVHRIFPFQFVRRLTARAVNEYGVHVL